MKRALMVEFKLDGRRCTKIYEPWEGTSVPQKGDLLFLDIGTDAVPQKITLQAQRTAWSFLTEKSNELHPKIVEVVARVTCKVSS